MEIKKLQIAIPAWVLHRKWEVMYLVLGPDGLSKLKDVAHLGLTEQLSTMVSKHVNDHLNKGVIPPKEIAPAILNISDDVLAGRPPTLRAGDYISLQQYIRQGGK